MTEAADPGDPGRPVQTGTEDAWVSHLHGLLLDGQYFLAYDRYLEAIELYPDSLRLSLLGALSLLRGGAVAEAQRLLTPLQGRLATRSLRRRRLVRALRRGLADEGDGDDEAALDDLVAAVRDLAAGDQAVLDDAETLRLAVEIHAEVWAHTGDPALLEHARALADEAFRLSGRAGDGLSAAGLEALSGDLDRAGALSRRVAELCRQDAAPGAETLLTLGQASVLLGDAGAAVDAFERANAPERRHYPAVVRARRRLQALEAAGVDVPEAVWAPLAPPVTMIFAGQPLDPPGAEPASCPPAAESVLAAEIGRQVDELGVEIGYCRAHPGSDLLFVEALLSRGAEVHVFLPFASEDFLRHCVAYAGRTWERRVRNALRLATSVTLVTEERYFGHDALFRFNNTLVKGMALWQAAFHQSNPHLMVAWDYLAENRTGSASDFMDDWPDITRLHLIDLDEIRGRMPADPAAGAADPAAGPPAVPDAERVEPERVIRTMLFADIEGFTKLGEAELPGLLRVLEHVGTGMGGEVRQPQQLETWGDAIYAVQDSALDLLDYTFRLQAGLEALDPASFGLSRPIRLRMGVHAGPVFEGVHPLTGRSVVYGSHVSRAARIEPITVAGEIYASQQFVAMLMSEDNSARHAALSMGQPYARRYVCEYLGTLRLPKNYGRQAIYHVRRPGPSDGSHGAVSP